MLDALTAAGEPITIAAVAEAVGVHPNTVRFHLDTLVENGQAERATGRRAGPGRPPQLFRAVPTMDPSGPRHYRLLAELLAEALSGTPDASERALRVGRAWGREVPEPDVPVTEQPARSIAAVQSLLADLGFAPEQLDRSATAALMAAESASAGRGATRVDDAGGSTAPAAGDPAGEAAAAAPAQGPGGPTGAAQVPHTFDIVVPIGLRQCPFLELARRAPDVVCPVHLGIVRGATQAWGSPVTATDLQPFVQPDICVLHLGPRTAA